jgi:hypothetical protein
MPTNMFLRNLSLTTLLDQEARVSGIFGLVSSGSRGGGGGGASSVATGLSWPGAESRPGHARPDDARRAPNGYRTSVAYVPTLCLMHPISAAQSVPTRLKSESTSPVASPTALRMVTTRDAMFHNEHFRMPAGFDTHSSGCLSETRSEA